MAARAYVFTFNNPETTELVCPEFVRYAIWQKESGSNETPHLQGYVELTKPQRLSALKKWLPKAHWEPRKGTPEQARDYCRKEESRLEGPWEFGKFTGQGHRSDLELVRDKILEGTTRDEVILDFPDVAAKYPKYIDAVHDIAKRKQTTKLMTIHFPRPWQAKVLELVNTEPDSRKIHWFYDNQGGQGKSHLAKHLVDAHNAFYTRGGKAMDITYAYDYQRIVILDYVRDAQEYVNYGVMEMFKDGLVTSNKYTSTLKRCNTPHVLVFANFLPDTSKMSADRWDIITL